MSTRTYNLQVRAGTGVALPSRQTNDELPPQVETVVNSLRENPPHIMGIAPRTGTTVAVRSYSDVVASRTPSPSRERPVVPSRVPEMELNSTLMLNPDQPRSGLDNSGTTPSEVPIDYNSSMEVGTPDQADSHWTTVQRRRARSHGSLPNKRTVTTEQVRTIEMATE